jgi:hypothetical protein
MPETAPWMKSARLFLGVAVLNALLAFPVLYVIYKHFSTDQTPMDVGTYMAMVEDGPGAVDAPWRYRALTPLLVRAMDFLPGYGIGVDFGGDAASPGSQKIFFHFLLLNFLLTAATSSLLFLYLRKRMEDGFAWAGSLLYLSAFFIVTANFIPMPDAACHLAIMAAVMLFDRGTRRAFLLAGPVFVLGVFTKEAFLVVMVPWILVHAAGDRRRLLYLLWAFLAAAAYFALTLAMPVAADPGSPAAGNLGRVLDPEWYFGSETYAGVRGARDLLRIFDPGTYSRTFLFHTLLSQLPLLAALAAWAWLRLARGVRVPFGRGLILFPALLWLGVVMGIDNNAPRLAFMVFPAVALFQARMLRALWMPGTREG